MLSGRTCSSTSKLPVAANGHQINNLQELILHELKAFKLPFESALFLY